MAKAGELFNLIEQARTLVNEASGVDAGEMTPQERALTAIDRLAHSRDADELEAQRLPLHQVLKDLAWTGKAPNKPMIRRMLEIFGEDHLGGPVYPAAIEMVGFSSAALLRFEPDRRARVFELSTTTPRAYAPPRRLSYTHRQVDRLLGHYPADRQEQMLSQLWEIAHMPRWWDEVHPGLISPDGGRVVDLTLSDADLQGLPDDDVERVRRVLDQPTVNDAFAEQVRTLRLPQRAVRRLEQVADGGIDADVRCGLTQLVQLRPSSRPASPVSQLLDALEFSLDGGDAREVMPNKPQDFRELYCDVDLEVFNTPEEIRQLSRVSIDLPQDGKQASVKVMRTSQQLLANKRYMGNCTGGYVQRCTEGHTAILAVHLSDGEVANISVVRGDGYYGGEGGNQAWRVREVNGRFNRRNNIPHDELRAVFDAMMEAINANRPLTSVNGVSIT